MSEQMDDVAMGTKSAFDAMTEEQLRKHCDVMSCLLDSSSRSYDLVVKQRDRAIARCMELSDELDSVRSIEFVVVLAMATLHVVCMVLIAFSLWQP